MRIAVIGSGNVGGTLGKRFADAGHEVVYGSRDKARGVPHAEAVRGADAVVLATPWAATLSVVRELADALDGTPLLDATNPLGAGFALEVGPNGESAGERIQAAAPKARVVKIFNTTGSDNMRDPHYDGAPTAMFYAGDDAGAKSVAHDLAAAIGFDPIDAGGLVRSRELEHLAVLWIGLAYGSEGAPAIGRNFAFRVMRR